MAPISKALSCLVIANATFNGIEKCKNLKNIILKKYYKIDNDRYSNSLIIPQGIIDIENLEYLITDADCSNKEIKSINLRYLVCKGINVKFNNKYDLKYYVPFSGEYEIIKPGKNIVANDNSYHYDKKYEDSFLDWSINRYFTYMKYHEIIKMY